MKFSYGIACGKKPGESCSGDQYLVRQQKNNVLLAVIDGVGHGKQAHAAACLAKSVIENTHDDLSCIMQACHRALSGSRGVVMTLASITPTGHVSWISIGNIFFIHWQKQENRQHDLYELFPKPGIVGQTIPALASASFHLGKGDILLFATDGLKPANIINVNPGKSGNPQQLADTVFSDCRTLQDDALLLIVRVDEALRDE